MILKPRQHPLNLNLNLKGIVLLGSMGALLSSMMNMNGSGSGYVVYAADEHLPASSSLLSSLSAFFKKPSSSFLPPSSLVTPALSLSSYALYSFAVDKYANHILDKMKDVPIPIPDQSGRRTTEVTASELKGTVDKRTNLVLNMSDRAKFNQWLMLSSSSASSTLENVHQINALCDTSATKGHHSFMYRSYVNYEELGALCKPFYSWRTLKFTFRKGGIMKFSKLPFDDCAGNIDGDDGDKEDSNKSKTGKAVAYVSIVDFFALGWFLLPIDVQWWGKIVENKEKDALSKYKIVWTYTEARTRLLWKNKIMPNPAACVKISSQPWDIVKCEDGILGFCRDGHGYLAYGMK